jgi:uncharacterized membrane protein YfcA
VSVDLALIVVLGGFVGGTLSALLGIGGGLFLVPFLVLGLGEGQHIAQGTSLLVIVPTAIVGVIAHHRREYVSFKSAFLLAIGGLPGAWLGAWLALRLSASVLQSVFGVFMVLMGVRLSLAGRRALRAERKGTVAPQVVPPGEM